MLNHNKLNLVEDILIEPRAHHTLVLQTHIVTKFGKLKLYIGTKILGCDYEIDVSSMSKFVAFSRYDMDLRRTILWLFEISSYSTFYLFI